MRNYTIKQYQKEDYSVWNDFIARAKNSTFLFHRDFIEYHGDKFDDFSLLIYDGLELIAVLPANRKADTVHSHSGLTYGGLVYTENLHLTSVIAVLSALLQHLHQNSYTYIYIKTLPSIYQKKPADEMLYALFLAKAEWHRRDSLSVIELANTISISNMRNRAMKKAEKYGMKIVEETDFYKFWNEILMPNLAARHSTQPVHSLEEIRYLKAKFPKQVRQFSVYCNDKIVAGTTIFETDTVAHCQYISKYEERKNSGALDFLFGYLIKQVYATKKYLDFGNSNEQEGKKLNHGLCEWKSGFGASIVIQDYYKIKSSNYVEMNDAVI